MKKEVVFSFIIVQYLLFFISCASTNRDWLIDKLSNEYREEKNIVREIINNRMSWLQLDPSEKIVIFEKNMDYKALLTCNIDDYIYTFLSVKYIENDNYFKISFINKKNVIKEYTIGISAYAYYTYNNITRKANIDGYEIFNISPMYTKASYAQEILWDNYCYTYDTVMAIFEYWKTLTTKQLFSTVNTLQIGRRYLLDKGYIHILNVIDSHTYSAKMNNYEFVLKDNVQSNRFYKYQDIKTKEFIYTEIEYVGTDTFVTTSGFLRQVPVYTYIGMYELPTTKTPKFLVKEHYNLPRETITLGLKYNDYYQKKNKGIIKIFDTVSKYNRIIF